MYDGYVDNFNGGCNSDPVVYSYPQSGTFCGKLGYYISAGGFDSRDLDWHEVWIEPWGYTEIHADAEEEMNFYEIEGDCDNLVIENGGIAGPCDEMMLTIHGEPGSIAYILCGPTHFWEGETYEYDYYLEIPQWDFATPTEEQSWSAVKALFE